MTSDRMNNKTIRIDREGRNWDTMILKILKQIIPIDIPSIVCVF